MFGAIVPLAGSIAQPAAGRGKNRHFTPKEDRGDMDDMDNMDGMDIMDKGGEKPLRHLFSSITSIPSITSSARPKSLEEAGRCARLSLV